MQVVLRVATSNVRRAFKDDKADWAKRRVEADSSCRGVWSTAETALGQTSTTAPTSLLSNGEVATNPFEMSETIAPKWNS